MILFSYTCIVSVLEFFVTVQAHTTDNLNSNELSLSLSNEQVTEYNYERTIKSATTENNQVHSVTTNIKTDFVHTIHSSKELDLSIADSTDIDETLNMEIMSELNMLNNNEASINSDYGTQSTFEISNTEVKIEGDTAFMSQNGINISPNYNTPTNKNVDLTHKKNGQDDDSNGNKLSDSSFTNKYQSSSYNGYGIQNQVDNKGEIPTLPKSSPSSKDSPSNATPTSPNKNINSAPNSNQNAAPQSTAPSATNSNQYPFSSSPNPLNGDSTGQTNGPDIYSNGNKLSDSSFTNKYQSSSYNGFGIQNQVDNKGEIPTLPKSSPSSKDSPSNATPTSPNKNINSAPNSNQNAAPESTAPSATNSNQYPFSSSPNPLNGDSTGQTNGPDIYSNGNKLSDSSFTNKYQSSSYNGFGIQNQVDNKGGIPTLSKSAPSSKDSPSNATPTSPNKNINSAPNSDQNAAPQSTAPSATNSNQYPFSSSPNSLNGDLTSQTNGPDNYSNGNKLSDSSFTNKYQSSSYNRYSIQNEVDNMGGIPTLAKSSPSSKDSQSNATPTSPNKNINSAPNSDQNAAPQSTAPSATNSNQYPFSSSPNSLNGDSTGQTNGPDNYSNGNKLSDSSFTNKYQSSSYNGYGIQNQVDNKGEIPTLPKSSPSSKDSPSNATPTSPNKNINSAPNSNQNAAPQSTAPSATNSNQYPFSSSPNPLNGDSTGQTNGPDIYSNGNKLSDSSFTNKYQSSSYNGFGIQNQVDNKGGIPTLSKSAPSSKDSPSNATPTSPNKNINSAPNSDQNAAPQSTAPSATNSNQYPFSSSPNSLNGDLTSQTNGPDNYSNGNKLSDSSFTNKYQSSSYNGYGIQNQVDNKGEIPTLPKSSPSSKDSPSNATPTSPNKNINSAPNSNQNAAPQSTAPSATNSNQYPFSSSPNPLNGDSTGQTNGPDIYSNGNKLSDSSFTNKYQSSSYNGFGIQNQVDNKGEIPTLPKSSPSSKDSPSNATPTSPNKNINSAPNSNQNAAPESTAPSATNSNQYPFSSSPNPLNGDSTGQTNGPDIYSNGNKLSDSSFTNKYQSSSYNGFGIQNQVDNKGGIPTLSKSAPSSKDSPSNATPTSPNKNINSAPNSDQNAAPQSTAPSATNSNQYPFSSSPNFLNGDLTSQTNGPDNYSNGNKLSDSSFTNKYQSSSYNRYSIQNEVDNMGGIPTLAKSSPSSKDSQSNATPTSPNKNINSAPNSDQNAAPQSTAPSATNSNQYPFSSSPNSLNGDSTGQTNGPDNYSNGNKLSDSSFTNKYQSSSYNGYGIQNQVDNKGEIPTLPKSSPSSKDSPSNATPTSPNKNINSAPNSNQNAAPQSTAPSATNSNQYPFSSSPNPLNGDSTGQTNGPDNYSNGNKLSDSSFTNKYQSSSYNGFGIQNQVDNKGGIPTLSKSAPSSKDSPSNATPTSPNKNINSAPNSDQNASPQSTAPSATNSNQYPFSFSPNSLNGDLTSQTNGPDNYSNGNKLSDSSFTNKYQSSSYNGYGIQNQVDNKGEIPTLPKSSPSSKVSPSNATPTSPNKNINSAPNSNQNAAPQSTAPSATNSNQYPFSSSPNSLNGDSTGQTNGQDDDSNGNKLNDQSSNYYEYIQNTGGQDTSYYYNPEISEYLNNQILQNSVSTFNLQNTDMPDQFVFIPSNPLNMPKGNSKDSLSGGVTGFNSPSVMNGLPYTVDQSSIGTEHSNFGAETYGSFNYYDDYELWNIDVVEASNDEQINTDDRYISINSDDVNNARVNIPILNENGGDYNNFFYADNSVNTVQSLDGNFDTQNNENYVDDYFGKIGYMQEPFNEPYAPNLNDRYENSQLYGFNQNSPPFKGYPYMGNDIETFDTNSYADISSQIPTMNLDLYNYNNIDGIEYDQTNIGIDETSLENNQLSMSDLNTFSSTQNSQKTDSFIDTDLTFDHMVYNFVDARNKDLETIDSNNIGKVNNNNLYNGQGFIGYNNMESINVPEYNQFTGDYAKTYLSNLGSFETRSSNTRSDAAVDIPEGPYLTPQLLNSNYNLPTSNDLNKQNTDLNSLLIENAQFNGYLYHKIDTSNVNNQVEGFAADNSNVSPMNAVDNRFNSIQTTVLSKNIELDVGHNVYDANGQVIGIINKPSGIVKTKNRHTFSGSSSYSSPNDSEFSDDIDAIGKDIKRGARDAIGNLHDNIKGAHDTTNTIAKTVGNIAGNAASKAADGIKETTKTAYQDSKDALKGVGNAVDEAADDVEETAVYFY